MNLKEAIKIHNELYNKEEIKKYCEALHIVCEKMQNCKPKKEYYKSSIINDYYIEYPYMELTISNGKAVYRRHNYSCSSKSKDKKIRSNYCLSLCRYNREEIEKLIEREIEKDKIKVSIRECKDVEIICPNCGETNIFYDVDYEEPNIEECWSCGEMLEFYVSDF